MSKVGGSDGFDDGAKHVANRRANEQKNGYHDNSYQNEDHRVFDQPLPRFSWQEKHSPDLLSAIE
jgi:hypothetical protein